MEEAAILELSNILRCEKEFIKLLYTKRYKVVRDINSLHKSELESNPLLIKNYTVTKHKSSDKIRNIYFPLSQKLKSSFKILSTWLTKKYPPQDCVHGFVKRRGIKTNAEKHLGCKYLLKLDLENFFEQIDQKRIVSALIKLGISKEMAHLIAKITTIDGILAQGFSTSPILSNIVAYELDTKLEMYCSRNNITYTRYADDMSFSSNINTPDIKELKQIISSCNFVLNENKTKLAIRGHYQSVTGLTIFDDLQPRIPKRIKRKLRLEVHYIRLYGLKNHAIRRLVKNGKFNHNPNVEIDLQKEINYTRERIIGWINFSKGIENKFSENLNKEFMLRM